MHRKRHMELSMVITSMGSTLPPKCVITVVLSDISQRNDKYHHAWIESRRSKFPLAF